MVKVYLFYYDNYIYAFTATKDLAKKFRQQRCMKKLDYRVKKMDDVAWSIFSSKYSGSMLISNPYDSKNGVIELITTYSEEEQITTFTANLEDAREDCLSVAIDRIGFKKGIEFILRDGLGMLYTTDCIRGGLGLNLNALAIAIYLFEPTFTGEGELKYPRVDDRYLGAPRWNDLE